MFKRTAAQLRSKVGKLIKKRMSFFKRKVPVGDQYPYQIHDPFIVLGEDTGYENLYLVGDNWQDFPEKPIIIVLGCNDWKFGFVADYFPEFRVAFGSRRLVGLNAIRVINKLKIRPSQFVIWGYTEKKILTFFLKLKGENVWRIEDGFVRSSALGASHATPYSLVIDKSGFYYNSYQSSDIEKLLNNYDFKLNPVLMEQAGKALQTILEFKVSKYNPVSLVKNSTIKIKKRIAVIGQVDNDTSIRLGNPDKWTSELLIKLAKYENPESEIIYRPHPEIFKGYQKSKFRRQKVEAFAKISSPEENIIDFIESVDHVYTITSLTGLEALLRGKKVTVVGNPFYAGWGLTDDRGEIKRRQRTLTLLEIFAAIYLIYPKYLADLKDNYTGLMATVMKVTADKEYNLLNSNIKDFDDPLDVDSMSYKLFLKTYFYDKNLINGRQVVSFFRRYASSGIDQILLSIFWGVIESNEEKKWFINNIKGVVDYKELSLFLDGVSFESNDIEIQLWIVYLLKEINEIGDAKELLDDTRRVYDGVKTINNEMTLEDDTSAGNELKFLVATLDIHLKEYNYQDAINTITNILKYSNSNVILLVNYLNILSRVLYNSFKIKESLAISELSISLGFSLNNRKAYKCYLDCLYILNGYSLTPNIDLAMVLLKSNPEQVPYLIKLFGRGTKEVEYIKKTFYLDKKYSISKIIGKIELGDYEQINNYFEMVQDESNNDKFIDVYTGFLHGNGGTKEAISILEKSLSSKLTEAGLKKVIKLNNFIGDFDKSKTYMDILLSRRISVNPTWFSPIYLGLGDIKKGYEAYLSESFAVNLKFLLGKNYRCIESVEDIRFEPNTAILSVYGPGDEIRFASIYHDLDTSYNGKQFSITCDSRLHTLFLRSFPNISFIPAKRVRSLDKEHPIEDYNQLPSAVMLPLLDNKSYKQVVSYEHIFLVTDYIAKFRTSYSDFPGKKYLIADKMMISKFKKLLPNNKFTVGLNWRSSLDNFSRMESYLTIKEISPVFDIEDIQFINLQYDECDEEVKWVEKHFPGKLINFEEIDQYNDFDSVAALMACLDLVVAPCTSVVELAGAVGCKAFFFANSGEINWRKIDDLGTDVWHNSITIIDTEVKGDKKNLVCKLVNELKNLTVK